MKSTSSTVGFLRFKLAGLQDMVRQRHRQAREACEACEPAHVRDLNASIRKVRADLARELARGRRC